jgi:hypothetical protein
MREKMSIDHLAAILRLGKKYEIDYLRDEGLKRLRFDFPKTLEQWNTSSEAYFDIVLDDGQDYKIVQLCDELSISSCLPIAHTLFVTRCTLASSRSFSTVLSAQD